MAESVDVKGLSPATVNRIEHLETFGIRFSEELHTDSITVHAWKQTPIPKQIHCHASSLDYAYNWIYEQIIKGHDKLDWLVRSKA